MATEPTYAFGPFQLDPRRRKVTRGTDPLALADREFDILRVLVARAGEVVAKDTLIEAAWKNLAVTDNSLEQVMSSLRRRLAPEGTSYIETVTRRGYRFRAPVTATVARQSDDALAELLAPYRVFLEGRAALETLERASVLQARRTFEEVLDSAPDYAPGHVGLANAHALAFETTRGDDVPEIAALQAAAHHAREACRLDPGYGEAWATLAFVLSRSNQAEATAAGRRAIALEPDNWRHHLRLAYATWGEARLRAARDAARLLPGLALAHYLAATVHVARQAMDDALRELAAGAAAQDRQQSSGRFGSVGLHLLLGLVALSRGDEKTAEDELLRELAFEPSGHIYAREACAHAWSAFGALRLRQERTPAALAAFDEALRRLPSHPVTLAALSVVADAPRRRAARAKLDERLRALDRFGVGVEAAMARAVCDVLTGHPVDAAARIERALQAAPAGTSAGWTTPVEPLLDVSRHPDAWVQVLATLQGRAA